jgi:streptogramin lyase
LMSSLEVIFKRRNAMSDNLKYAVSPSVSAMKTWNVRATITSTKGLFTSKLTGLMNVLRKAIRYTFVPAAVALITACGGGGSAPSIPSGVVTTLAGAAGVTGSADGTGSAARFNIPFGVAVDSSGNAYVSDSRNYTIRKITSAGVVTTLAGTAGLSGDTDGTGAAARFFDPRGVAVDASGNVYVADAAKHTIRKITNAGVVTTLAGTSGVSGTSDGTGAAARFSGPLGVAVDSSGNIYVADYGNSAIRKISSAGVVTTLAGTAGQAGSTDGTGAAASFRGPYSVTVDSSGNVYVADYGNSAIRKITSAGVVTTLAGTAGQTGSTDGTGAAARFSLPGGVIVNSSGVVYVANSFTIRKVTSDGVVTTLAGTAGQAGSTDGTGVAARFAGVYGIAVDSSGNIYVADAVNSTIRKITP